MRYLLMAHTFKSAHFKYFAAHRRHFFQCVGQFMLQLFFGQPAPEVICRQGVLLNHVDHLFFVHGFLPEKVDQGGTGNPEQLELYVEVVCQAFPVVPELDECKLRHLLCDERRLCFPENKIVDPFVARIVYFIKYQKVTLFQSSYSIQNVAIYRSNLNK